MAYDERLAERIRFFLKRWKGMEEKRMFGGLCFMLNGHMCCGIVSWFASCVIVTTRF
jgi:hypothetical protein